MREEALDHTLWRTGLGKRLWTCRETDCGLNELEVGSVTTPAIHILVYGLRGIRVMVHGNADIVNLSTDKAKIFRNEFISVFMRTWIHLKVNIIIIIIITYKKLKYGQVYCLKHKQT